MSNYQTKYRAKFLKNDNTLIEAKEMKLFAQLKKEINNVSILSDSMNSSNFGINNQID
jgi:hypothetical protein